MQQTGRGLRGGDWLRVGLTGEQGALPLGDALPRAGWTERDTSIDRPTAADADLSDVALALLRIIKELPSRYGPEQLAASVGEGRVGLAGRIIDRVLSEDADVDESTAKLSIADLCQRGLVGITPPLRLEADESGREIRQKQKPG